MFSWGEAGLVSRELVSHGTVGLVLFRYGRRVEFWLVGFGWFWLGRLGMVKYGSLWCGDSLLLFTIVFV